MGGMKLDYVYYNSNYKLEYMNQMYESGTKYPIFGLERLFTKVAPFEVELKKDICEFTISEIERMYLRINSSVIEVLTNMNSQLLIYTDWCINNKNIDNNNCFKLFNVNRLRGFVNKDKLYHGIVMRDELLSFCWSLPNRSDAFTLLAIFEGVKGRALSEILNLSVSDFYDNHVVVNGLGRDSDETRTRILKVSDELVNFAKMADKEQVYYSYCQRNCKVNLVDQGRIIKNKVNAYHRGSQIDLGKRINVMLNNVGWNNDISIQSIIESGKIHYIKTRARELNVLPKEFLFSTSGINELRKVYDCSMKACVFYDKYKVFIDDEECMVAA